MVGVLLWCCLIIVLLSVSVTMTIASSVTSPYLYALFTGVAEIRGPAHAHSFMWYLFHQAGYVRNPRTDVCHVLSLPQSDHVQVLQHCRTNSAGVVCLASNSMNRLQCSCCVYTYALWTEDLHATCSHRYDMMRCAWNYSNHDGA
jgi:hypothetical protein